jgi:hypothetical protein
MPLNLNALERLVLFRLNRGPAPMLDLFGAATFEAVALADRMGVFDALAEPRSAADLAAELDADADGIGALLGLLGAQGYVEERRGTYRTTAMAERWVAGGEGIGPWLRFWDELVFPFLEENMEAAVRNGEPSETLYEHLDGAEAWRVAQEGFRAAARVTADGVVKRIDLGGAKRLLDVGGGHGLFAAALCAANPELEATVFDLAPALGITAETAAEYGVADRLGTRAGDYTEDDLGEGYGAALVFNVVHAGDGPTNTALLEEVCDALEPGGRVFVLDQFAGSGRGTLARAGIGFVNLTYLATLGASVHPADEVERWLREAGFRDVERESVRGVPGVSLLTARRAG